MKLKHELPLKLAAISAVAIGAAAVIRKNRTISFDNRVVLITGGSRGLGLLLAREFASQGARVAVCARDEEELKRAQSTLERDGLHIETFVCDLTDKTQIATLIDNLRRELGPIEILVNNAAIIQVGPMEAMAIEDYEYAMALNFWAPLHTTLAVVPEMKARGFGRIINIASIGGKVNSPHLLPYCASKFAVTGLSQGMRIELAKDGILVTTVCPNLMQIGSMLNSEMKGQHRKEFALAHLLSTNPLISTAPARAAKWIVNKARHGDAFVVPSLRGTALVGLGSLFPGLMTELLGLTARFMPTADGPESVGTGSATGKQSTSSLAPSILTAVGDKNALELNEIEADELAMMAAEKAPLNGGAHA